MKTKFKETRLWSVDAVRKYCIDYHRYTYGNISAYNNLLDYVADHNPSTESIQYVAEDIIKHSESVDIANIALVMFQIQRECVTIIFKECNDWPINDYQE